MSCSGDGEPEILVTVALLTSSVAKRHHRTHVNSWHVYKYNKECFCNTLFLFRFVAMVYVLLINFFSFIIFGLDKRKAVLHQRRIPETTLLGISFLGGSIGSIIAMLIFRHKISKTSFLLKFGGVVLIQVALIYFFEKKYWDWS